MKRIINIFLVLILAFSMNVFADNSITLSDVNVMYNPADDSVIVSGIANTNVKKLPLVMTIKFGDTIIAAEQTYTFTDEDGFEKFEFEPLKLPNDATSGDYTVNISGRFVDEVIKSFEFYGVDEIYPIVSKLCNYINADEFSGFINELAKNYGKLNIDYSLYGDLETSGKKSFEMILLTKNYSLGEYDEYTDNIARRKALRKVIGEIAYDYSNAIMISQFNDIDESAAYLEWEKNYSSVFLSTKDTELYNDFYSVAKSERQYGSHIKVFNECLSENEIVDAAYEAALLTLIETKQSWYTKSIFEKFPLIFDTSSVNVSADIKDVAYSKIAGQSYNRASDAVSAFKEYTKSNTGSGAGGSGGNAGKGGKGGSGWGNSNGNFSVGFTKDDTNQEIFFDLNEAKWAKEAVEYLYKRNIVNGRGNGFEPNANVTRGEFLKMVLLLNEVKIEIPTGEVFDDVPKNEWFAPYVYTAKILDIAKGDDKGRFNPNGNISRQDMAVLVCRVLGLKSVDVNEDIFADGTNISRYALDSVNALYEKGLIKGKGDNRFAPLDTATRAEAAQMLYNIIIWNK